MARIQILSSPQWAGAAADCVTEVTARNPVALIGFPTGNTPVPLYAELRRRAAAGLWDASRLRGVMLDEYLDPPAADISSWSWLRRELFDPLGIAAGRILRMPHQRSGIEAACRKFEEDLQSWGGCDLQLLGLGANGHIAFNEPNSDPGSRTRAVTLSAETARANAAYWPSGFVPEQAATMGIATILEARSICLLVRGAEKAAMLRAALQGPVGREVPASWLRQAARLTVVADRAAASALV